MFFKSSSLYQLFMPEVLELSAESSTDKFLFSTLGVFGITFTWGMAPLLALFAAAAFSAKIFSRRLCDELFCLNSVVGFVGVLALVSGELAKLVSALLVVVVVVVLVLALMSSRFDLIECWLAVASFGFSPFFELNSELSESSDRLSVSSESGANMELCLEDCLDNAGLGLWLTSLNTNTF